MNILLLIKQLQEIADKYPTIEVWCEDGMDPSDLCPVRKTTINLAPRTGNVIVEIVS